jgi:RecB family endonuclease NucS
MLVFAVVEDRMSCAPMRATQLATLGIFETSHLERWVVDHPEVLGDDVLIVTTQYGRWSSDSGDLAKERLDILGLDSSGQLVVVETQAGHRPERPHAGICHQDRRCSAGVSRSEALRP